MKAPKIKISTNFVEAKNERFKKYFRYDNSEYWLNYYSKKLKKLDIGRERLYARIIRRYAGKQAMVVDFASGIGFFLKELKRAGLKPEGIDLFPEMIKEAKKYLKDRTIKIHQTDILSTPYKPNSIDCISMMSIIEHFPIKEVREDILPEAYRLIKPKGYLFVHVPTKTAASVFSRLFRRYITKDLPSWAIDDDGDITHKMWLTPQQYITLIEGAGFKFINYDSHLTRSNMKPKFISDIMRFIEKGLSISDTNLIETLEDESADVKLIKYLKQRLSLTNYFLFQKP